MRHLSCILLLALISSCTGNFNSINTDKAGVDSTQLSYDYYTTVSKLNIIQQGIYFNYDFGSGRNWPFQTIQNLSADLFSGFMHSPKPYNQGSHNSDYNLQDNWNQTAWTMTYQYIFPQVYRAENETRTAYPALFGVTKILKVMLMHRITDLYGPIIYSRFADPQGNYLPDSQQEVYGYFFQDLDSAETVIKSHLAMEPTEATRRQDAILNNADQMLDGQYASWLKLLNSLRMRLAMRISMIDPSTAESQFIGGLTDPYGCFEGMAQGAAMKTGTSYTNPLGEISRSWHEASMNANMESWLGGWNDPRMVLMFDPCTDFQVQGGGEVLIAGQYHGIRQGTCFPHTYYYNLSAVNISTQTDAVLLHAAEVWLLRAEAALRGWTTEDAGSCYEKGVRASFERWRAGEVDTYLADENSTPADYRDVIDPALDIAAQSDLTVRWEESDTPERKLERIVTQKWIALFPEGCEAWAEQRRTGYPKLFPVLFNNSQQTISTQTMIRRIPFPGGLATSNPPQYQALVTALDGADNGGTRLWWDTGRNF